MNARSFWALALALLGGVGLAGRWPSVPMFVLLVGVAWLPGRVLCDRLAPARHRRYRAGADIFAGPGALALQTAFSLALLVPVFLPFFAMAAAPSAALTAYAGVLTAIGLLGLVASRKPMPSAPTCGPDARGEWGAAVLAVAVLVPVVTSFAGATIDDWWDLSFIRAYIERPGLSFAEPLLGSDQVHPRFLWNSWYIVQAVVLTGRVEEAVAFQSGPLAAFVCVCVVSAHSLLARSVFERDGDGESGEGRRRAAQIATCIAILAIPLWLYGTEALPFFTRLHQDKFVAGLVLVPVLLATTVHYLRREATAVCATAVFGAALATCATHSLVFGVGMIGVAALVLSEIVAGRLRTRALLGLAAVTLPPLVYPLAQAIVLRSRFAAQRISLDNPDNPVVLAHLSLERLLAPETLWYVVHPGAVFGPIALLALAGACLCLRYRRDPDARVLVTLTFIPAVIIFIPGLAALAGNVIVPWMVYRIGWLVPVPLLLGYLVRHVALEERHRMTAILVVALALAAVVPGTVDRLQRDMREHPARREGGPRGTTKHLYDFLAGLPPSSLIVAETGVSRLIPSMSGQSTLAMAERATLVFSPDEATAYTRLRDRAEFFAMGATAENRAQIVRRYGLTHAVFRRRWITDGSADRWLRGSVGAGYALLAESPGRYTHHATRDQLLARLPGDPRVVFENEDYFLVALGRAVQREVGAVALDTASTEVWSAPFEPVLAHDAYGATRVVAGAVRSPGGRAQFHPPPVALGTTAFPVWSSGGEVWDDAPSEVRIELSMNGACRVNAVEVRPYLPTGRREVFELTADGRSVRRIASHKEPVILALDGRERDSVTVQVRSMLGASFGLTDVRLLSAADACSEDWTAFGEPSWPQTLQSVEAGIRLVRNFPYRATAALPLAGTLADSDRTKDALAVLRLAAWNSSEETVPLIERGLLEDGGGAFADALASFKRAVATDSNSAWARGCLAWAELRRQRLLGAVWHAWTAARLDHDYADAHTILASVAKRVGLRPTARKLLRRAVAMDRYRSWAYLELARMADEEGDRERAIEIIEGFLVVVPFDEDALASLEYYRDTAGER